MRARRALFACVTLVAASALAGCFAHVEDRCRCEIVRHQMPIPPRVPDGQRGLVVLVHGAFGFGDEWTPVTEALRRRPELSWFAFAWPGPFGNQVPARAEELRITLQRALDRLPASTHEVLVLAHSAGGAVANYAARRLAVPDGVLVHVVLLDAARINVAPYQISREVDTPLGLALGTKQEPTPPVPPRVDIGDFRANDAPRRLEARGRDRMPQEIGVLPSDGESVTYLGRRVTHGGAVALVSLPLIERLARAP